MRKLVVAIIVLIVSGCSSKYDVVNIPEYGTLKLKRGMADDYDKLGYYPYRYHGLFIQYGTQVFWLTFDSDTTFLMENKSMGKYSTDKYSYHFIDKGSIKVDSLISSSYDKNCYFKDPYQEQHDVPMPMLLGDTIYFYEDYIQARRLIFKVGERFLNFK